MFTESVRISCSFPACCGGSAKYQTCLIIHRPSLTLDPNHGSPVLSYHETSLSLSLKCYTVHLQSISSML